MQIPTRCMLARGCASKGAYVLTEDPLKDRAARDVILLSVMSTPDTRGNILSGGGPSAIKRGLFKAPGGTAAAE